MEAVWALAAQLLTAFHGRSGMSSFTPRNPVSLSSLLVPLTASQHRAAPCMVPLLRARHTSGSAMPGPALYMKWPSSASQASEMPAPTACSSYTLRKKQLLLKMMGRSRHEITQLECNSASRWALSEVWISLATHSEMRACHSGLRHEVYERGLGK